jgi:hypothetical protein
LARVLVYQTIFAEILMAHPHYVDDCVMEMPNALPVKIYLAFRSHDIEHDWEITDLDSKIWPKIPDESAD